MVSFQNKHQKFEMLKKNKQASVPSFVSDVLCALNRRNEKKASPLLVLQQIRICSFRCGNVAYWKQTEIKKH